MTPQPRLQHCSHVLFTASAMREFYACMMKRPWWTGYQLRDPAAVLPLSASEREAAARQQADQPPARSHPEWEVFFWTSPPTSCGTLLAASATLDGVAMHLRMYPRPRGPRTPAEPESG